MLKNLFRKKDYIQVKSKYKKGYKAAQTHK